VNKLKLIFVLIVAGIASTSSFAQKISKESVEINGKKRVYYLYVPQGLKPESQAPLVLLFHGSNRNGFSVAEKWKQLADREGLILIAPDSVSSSVWSVPKDGPGPLYQLVEFAKNKHPINPRRVYMFGHSGGAIFALLMSLYESEYFAATSVHAGALDSKSAELAAKAKRKIPMQLQVGSADPLFPVRAVRATRDLLASNGFKPELIEIPGHDHWYYDRAPRINQDAWNFLKAHELSDDPRSEEHRFKAESVSVKKVEVDHYSKGVERQQANDPAGAIAAYTKAIELDPNHANAYNNRGVIYLEQQNVAAALSDFTRSIAATPTDAAYHNRGKIYFSQDKFPQAIADFSEVLKLKPSAEAYVNRGTAYWRTDEYSLALKDFERAIEVDPNFGRAYILRGLFALKGGDVAAASKDFDKGFALDPKLHAEFDSIIQQMQKRE
jgi:tetratricopeptide (TPR) repeat protein